MYEVHYSDGADHAGVGRFECWHDAKRFVDALRATGYEAYITDLTESREVYFKLGKARPAWPHNPPLPK